MSQQLPPPPYGGPPGPPYGGPPGPYPPGQPDQPRSGRSNKASFWIGVLLAVPAIVVAGFVTGAGSAIVNGAGGDPGLGAAVSGALALLLLGGFIAMIVFERTRWIALGILAGTAILLIIVAGACVALLVAMSNTYG